MSPVAFLLMRVSPRTPQSPVYVLSMALWIYALLRLLYLMDILDAFTGPR